MSSKFAFTPLPPVSGDANRPALAAALSGTWRGRLVEENGYAESFTLLRDASVDAVVAGRFLFFATPRISPTGVKLLDANDRAFVALIGPYFDQSVNDDVVTVLEGVRNGNVLEGMFYTRNNRRRETVRSGRFVARRAEPANRAA
jgi:hypothetical protein